MNPRCLGNVYLGYNCENRPYIHLHPCKNFRRHGNQPDKRICMSRWCLYNWHVYRIDEFQVYIRQHRYSDFRDIRDNIHRCKNRRGWYSAHASGKNCWGMNTRQYLKKNTPMLRAWFSSFCYLICFLKGQRKWYCDAWVKRFSNLYAIPWQIAIAKGQEKFRMYFKRENTPN